MNNIKTVKDIAKLIARRDGISFDEAMEAIDNCREELFAANTLADAEDSIAYWLSLEPDYLDILLLS